MTKLDSFTFDTSAADLEPFQTLSSKTQYWLYWAGHLGYWTISKMDVATSSL